MLNAVGIFIFVLAPLTAQATTYYVAIGGSDSNTGGPGDPFATIQHAIDQTAAGDTVFVNPGTFVGARFYFHSGTQALPITLHGEPGAIVNTPGPLNTNNDNIWVRNSDYIIVEGFEVLSAPRSGIAVQADPEPDESLGDIVRNNNCHDNGRWGIFTGYAKDLLIEYNETSYSGLEHGIYVSNSSDNPIIRYNVVHHNLSSGIQINADPALDGDGIISNALIDSNVIYENGQPTGGGAAINLASVRDSLIVNNLLYNNHKGGIAGWDDGDGNQWGTMNNRFYNNTVVQPSDGRAVVSLIDGSINNEIKNNILIHLGFRPSVNTDASSQPGIDSDYNLVKDTFSDDDNNFITLADWRALGAGHDQNSILYDGNAAALFVNAGSNDYHILSGSQALDAGITVSGVPDDLDGVPRPQGAAFDIGCYEFIQTCPGDITDPSTSITSPTDGDTVGNTVIITADASDDCAVTKVEFYLDGNLLGFDTTSPYTFDWNTRQSTNGSHALTTVAYDPSNNTGTSAAVNVTVDNQCLFCDDFENGVIDGWTFVKGNWVETGGNLNGTYTRKADIISPIAWGGCSQCTIETDMSVTAGGRVSLLGWYVDKRNAVEIALMQDKHKVLLKRKVNGRIVAKAKFLAALNANQNYHVQVDYNGTVFTVLLDGVQILSVPAGAPAPSGIVGFRIKPAAAPTVTGTFEQITVY
ncbi:MAG TPA: Ig-like domain-containing protein [Acidobacteriota bacterium]|nr:Ig-like domain-containing protein [Acidobacteriota bacterium]